MRELTLGSQMQQGLHGQVKTDIVNLAKKKAKGQKVGPRGFTKEQNCIPLPQAGVTYRQLKNKNCFAIQKIGKFRVSGAEQIKDGYEMPQSARKNLTSRLSCCGQSCYAKRRYISRSYNVTLRKTLAQKPLHRKNKITRGLGRWQRPG